MKRTAILAAICLCFAATQVFAQGSYPSKPVKLIVPVTTGGPSDLVARILGDKLATALGKPVIIENRPGASQTVASFSPRMRATRSLGPPVVTGTTSLSGFDG